MKEHKAVGSVTCPEWMKNSIFLMMLFSLSIIAVPIVAIVLFATGHWLAGLWATMYTVYVWSKYVNFV